jgi:hypothetical protein
MFWWEQARAEAVERSKLHVFLAEYCADPMEAFQNTTASVFPAEMLNEQRMRTTEPVIMDVSVKGVERGLIE